MKTLHTGNYENFRKTHNIGEFKITGQLFYETTEDVMKNAEEWLYDKEDFNDTFTNNEMFFCGILLAIKNDPGLYPNVKILSYVGDELPKKIDSCAGLGVSGFMDGYQQFLNKIVE